MAVKADKTVFSFPFGVRLIWKSQIFMFYRADDEEKLDLTTRL